MDCRKRGGGGDEELLPAEKRSCGSSGPTPSSSPSSCPASTSAAAAEDADADAAAPPPCSLEPSASGSEMETTSSSSGQNCISQEGDDEHHYENEEEDNNDDGEDDDGSGGSSGDGYSDDGDGGVYKPSQGQLKNILSGLQVGADAGLQLAALSELCQILCFSEDGLASSTMITLVPRLVELAGQGGNAEVMLLAIRALTYLCDMVPRSAALIVSKGAIPVLCMRLSAIEYVDVAEQCLQALQKISVEQPVACLKDGVINACLAYFDFFSISIQRVALSTVSNLCKSIPDDSSPFVMDAIPIVCNILQNEDKKLVETALTCLTRIADSFSNSLEMLDKLCDRGLICQCVNMLALNGRIAFGEANYHGIIGLLSRLASGSLVAVKTLLELNISSTLRIILTESDALNATTSRPAFTGEYSNQVHEVFRLLNLLLPPVMEQDKDIQLSLGKEFFFADQPQFLYQFSVDILPVAIQVVNSSTSMFICYGCISIINSIVYFSTPNMLLDILKDTNISSFLASLLTRKDHHVLISALKTVDILLKKQPDLFLNQFVKEGVFCAIDTISMLVTAPCTSSQSAVMDHSSQSNSQMADKNISRCLCYAFDLSYCPSQAENCKLGKDNASSLAKVVKETYFTSSKNLEIGSTEVLRNLKTFCSVLDDNVYRSSQTDYSSENEEYLTHILDQIISELTVGGDISTFEFIESGLVKSFLNYLCNGQYLRRELDNKTFSNHCLVVQKRFETFTAGVLSRRRQHWEDSILTNLVRKLQSALSSLDNFSVISGMTSKPQNVYANIPFGRYTVHPCLRVHFVRDESDSVLRECPSDVLNVEPSSSMDAIEGFLWPKLCSNKTSHDSGKGGKGMAENADDLNVSELKVAEDSTLVSDYVVKIDSDGRHAEAMDNNPASIGKGHDKDEKPSKHIKKDTKPKIFFYLEGIELDRSLTFFQAILQQRVNSEPDMIVGPGFWNKVYKVTYKSAAPTHNSELLSKVGQSSSLCNQTGPSWMKLSFFSSLLAAELPCKLEKTNPCYDILFMLKVLEGLNKYAFELVSSGRSNALDGGRIPESRSTKMMTSVIPESEFLSCKMTEKLEQQMTDPLSSSTGNMPAWCIQLIAACPFLFSFKARSKFFKMTVLGYSQNQQDSRSNTNSVNNGHPQLTSFTRKKVEVDRGDILESAKNMMKLHASSKLILEVEYNKEVGTGLGPTVEFYTLVGREFQKVGLDIWRGDHHAASLASDYRYVVASRGLFPRPWSPVMDSSNGVQFSEVLKKFNLLGWFIAKAFQDGRILDLPLSKAFYKLILEQELDIYDIPSFDPEHGSTLLELQCLANWKRVLEVDGSGENDLLFQDTRIEDLCIDFSLPGYPNYILNPGSKSKMVDSANLGEYVSLVVDATVRNGISRQLEAFKSGFNKVLPLKSLQLFSEDELDRLLCGEQDTWAFDDLLNNIKFDHGYTSSSPPVINFLETIQEFDCNQRRAFLQFVTGAPRLPPGGLAALNPKLTVVRKHVSGSVDLDLPSVMTCANYLKMPPYSSKEKTKEKLMYAITEGQGSFHLS